jgi:hypothetical protein
MWCGWVRRDKRGKWELVTQSDTLDECARRLSEWTRRHGLRLSNVNECITGGAPPATRKGKETR